WFALCPNGAIYKIESLGTGPGQQDYKNNQNLAAERWHNYEISVNNQDYIVRLNGQEVTRFRRSNTDLRGNPPSVDPHLGVHRSADPHEKCCVCEYPNQDIAQK